MEKIVRMYRCENEIITISLYGNGKYYIRYPVCTCGGFETLCDAINTLSWHRPKARLIAANYN